MECNYDLSRLLVLRETDRRTFVYAGFPKNDGLRYVADLLGLLFGTILVLSIYILAGGVPSK